MVDASLPAACLILVHGLIQSASRVEQQLFRITLPGTVAQEDHP
jgi:hypothetical protein